MIDAVTGVIVASCVVAALLISLSARRRDQPDETHQAAVERGQEMSDLSDHQEYRCGDCGRHIVQFGGPYHGLCAACQIHPRWWEHHDLARVLDPDHLRDPSPPSQHHHAAE